MKKIFCYLLILSVFSFITGCSFERSGLQGSFTDTKVNGNSYMIYSDKTDDMVVILAISQDIAHGHLEMRERVQKNIFEKISRLPQVFIDGKEFTYDKNALYVITETEDKLTVSKREIDPSKLKEYPEKDWSPNEATIYEQVNSFFMK